MKTSLRILGLGLLSLVIFSACSGLSPEHSFFKQVQCTRQASEQLPTTNLKPVDSLYGWLVQRDLFLADSLAHSSTKFFNLFSSAELADQAHQHLSSAQSWIQNQRLFHKQNILHQIKQQRDRAAQDSLFRLLMLENSPICPVIVDSQNHPELKAETRQYNEASWKEFQNYTQDFHKIQSTNDSLAKQLSQRTNKLEVAIAKIQAARVQIQVMQAQQDSLTILTTTQKKYIRQLVHNQPMDLSNHLENEKLKLQLKTADKILTKLQIQQDSLTQALKQNQAKYAQEISEILNHTEHRNVLRKALVRTSRRVYNAFPPGENNYTPKGEFITQLKSMTHPLKTLASLSPNFQGVQVHAIGLQFSAQPQQEVSSFVQQISSFRTNAIKRSIQQAADCPNCVVRQCGILNPNQYGQLFPHHQLDMLSGRGMGGQDSSSSVQFVKLLWEISDSEYLSNFGVETYCRKPNADLPILKSYQIKTYNEQEQKLFQLDSNTFAIYPDYRLSAKPSADTLIFSLNPNPSANSLQVLKELQSQGKILQNIEAESVYITHSASGKQWQALKQTKSDSPQVSWQIKIPQSEWKIISASPDPFFSVQFTLPIQLQSAKLEIKDQWVPGLLINEVHSFPNLDNKN